MAVGDLGRDAVVFGAIALGVERAKEAVFTAKPGDPGDGDAAPAITRAVRTRSAARIPPRLPRTRRPWPGAAAAPPAGSCCSRGQDAAGEREYTTAEMTIPTRKEMSAPPSAVVAGPS